jgi:hypothetical protein
MTVKRIFLDSETSDQESSVAEHSNVDFILVEADRVHVWTNGSHYIGTGEVDSVEEGDLFYYPGAPGVETFEYVYEISDKYESDSGTMQVKVNFLFPPDKESMECGEDNILHHSPTLLTDSGYTLQDSPELTRVREFSEG